MPFFNKSILTSILTSKTIIALAYLSETPKHYSDLAELWQDFSQYETRFLTTILLGQTLYLMKILEAYKIVHQQIT